LHNRPKLQSDLADVISTHAVDSVSRLMVGAWPCRAADLPLPVAAANYRRTPWPFLIAFHA